MKYKLPRLFIDNGYELTPLGGARERQQSRQESARGRSFGLRRDHVLIEIIASCPDRPDRSEERRDQQWARDARRAFDPIALPGGYPNLLGPDDADRAAGSFGPNAERLAKVKQLYDPDNVFRSAIPLPIGRRAVAAE